MDFGNEDVRVCMEDDDRISSLPDEIIHLILSFNDTKFAVQTSVLSPRWRLIWTTLPYLKFSTAEFRNHSQFSNFVKRVLSCRDNRIDVSRLDLYVSVPDSQKLVLEIGKYAVSHNVQKVTINAFKLRSYSEKDEQLPLCFFSSQSLKHLSIKADRLVSNIFPLPHSPWDCPALTTIELTDIRLPAKYTKCLDLFSRCVSLENLTLINCRSESTCLDLFSKCVRLKDLTLINWCSIGFEVVKILCPQLLRLRISCVNPSRYEILAPNLSSFSYEGFSPPLLSTGGLYSLEKVKLRTILTCPPNKEAPHEFINLLYELRNSRFLTLGGSVIEFLSKVLDLLEHQPSPFCNLKCLKIEDVEMPQKPTESDMRSKVTNYLLSNSPTATVSMEFQKESNWTSLWLW